MLCHQFASLQHGCKAAHMPTGSAAGCVSSVQHPSGRRCKQMRVCIMPSEHEFCCGRECAQGTQSCIHASCVLGIGVHACKDNYPCQSYHVSEGSLFAKSKPALQCARLPICTHRPASSPAVSTAAGNTPFCSSTVMLALFALSICSIKKLIPS